MKQSYLAHIMYKGGIAEWYTYTHTVKNYNSIQKSQKQVTKLKETDFFARQSDQQSHLALSSGIMNF